MIGVKEALIRARPDSLTVMTRSRNMDIVLRRTIIRMEEG